MLFICFWIDLVCTLATTRNTSVVPGYTRVWIHENSRALIQIFINENKSSSQDPLAYSESLQHPNITILLINIYTFFRSLSSVHLFLSNQCLQAIEFVDRHISEKR